MLRIPRRVSDLGLLASSAHKISRPIHLRELDRKQCVVKGGSILAALLAQSPGTGEDPTDALLFLHKRAQVSPQFAVFLAVYLVPLVYKHEQPLVRALREHPVDLL